MEFTWILIFLSWIPISILVYILKRSSLNPRRPPPGPYPLPIVGNLLSLGNKPHKSFADLATKYGPVISLQLGSLTTVVVSSVSAAKEVLQKNDVFFSNRHVQDAITVNDHHLVSVIFMAPNARWRNLRKICNSHVFSTSRLDASQELRKKKVQQLLSYIKDCSETATPVNIGLAAFSVSLNLLSNTFFSVDLVDPNSETSRELKDLVWDVVQEVGRPNIVDFFPLLKWFDPQGVRPRIKDLIERIFKVFDKMIDPRLKLRKEKGHFEDKDVLDALLSLSDESGDEFTLKDIRHLLTDLFTAGTDTTSNTIEWAMAELLHNPDKLKKAQKEVDEVVGKGIQVEEVDIIRLPYLQAIVKETLRLHPPTPLLVPREANTDVELYGFTVSKKSQVFINVWAMGRDPSVWDKVECFKPERFLGSTIDYKGHDFELIPFGGGRRRCPGLPLAHRMLHLVLGSLIHSFDWKLPGGVIPENMDMSDKFGLSLQKDQPLCAIPVGF